MSTVVKRSLMGVAGVLLLAIVLSAVALVAAPFIIKTVAVDYLKDHQLTQSAIKNIDFNIFAGHFDLESFSAATDSKAHIDIEKLDVDFSLWPVVDNKVEVKAVMLDGLNVIAHQRPDGSFSVGYESPAEEQTPDVEDSLEKAMPSANETESSLWQIDIATIELSNLFIQVLNPDGNHSISVSGNLRITDTYLNTQGQLVLGEVTISDWLIQWDEREPLAWKMLTIRDVQIDQESASIESIVLEGVVASVLRMSDQRLQVEHMLDHFVLPEASEEETTTDTTPKAEDHNKTPPSLRWRIGAVSIDSASRIKIEDESISPHLKRDIHFREFRIGALDSGNSNRTTRIDIDFTTDEHDELSLRGDISPLAESINAELTLVIDQFSATDYSPYVEHLAGYSITSGVVNLESDILVLDDVVKIENDIALKRFNIEEAQRDKADEFNAGMPMPINTALSLVRDSNDVIALSLPVDGTLDDPNFKIGPALRSSLATALTKASLGYIKYAIQPWGAALFVGEQLVGAATKVRFEPVVFEPGAIELSNDMQEYLGKVSLLFNEKPALHVVACAVSTVDDKQAIIANKKNLEGDAELNAQLNELAAERFRVFKSFLVDQGVQSSQIVECLPKYDTEESALPAINLSL